MLTKAPKENIPLDDPDEETDSDERAVTAVNEDTVIVADNTEDKSKTERIDTKALNGLRGILSVHIMIFHALLYSKSQINILGSVQMSLFFLISGFIFGLSEGKQKYLTTKCCTELKSYADHENEDETGFKHFDGKNFYQRRMARILPLFYLTNLICIPLVFAGYHWLAGYFFIIAIVLCLFVTGTWFLTPLVLNGPQW